MKHLRQVRRFLHIIYIVAKYRLDHIIFAKHFLAPIRFFAYLNPKNWVVSRAHTRGEALRSALQELGPIYVKFGQALSTRRDILPDDIADELAILQDKVTPFSGEVAVNIIENAFSKSILELFQEFSIEPLASASIAQVHVAKLHDGEEVVVKVLRPEIEKKIKIDIELMYTIAKIILRFIDDAKRLRPLDVVAEFEMTILDELDFLREAANASQLRRNFENSELLYVPSVHWPLVCENVFVMERIHGIPISDIEALKRHHVNIKKLAERGVDIFFTQVFCHSFFHADMHPGNIFVDYQNPENPRYICVDFGIMGSLNPSDKRYLAENFQAFFNRDYYRVAQLHIDSGWIPPTVRVNELEAAIRTVSEPIFDRPLNEISFAQMLLRLFQTGHRFDMQIQPQLILLQKTMFSIEGLGASLYPNLNLWAHAKPFIDKWVSDQFGVSHTIESFKSALPYWQDQIPAIPGLIHDFLQHAKHQRLLQATQLTDTASGAAMPSSRFRVKSFLLGVSMALILEHAWIYFH